MMVLMQLWFPGYGVDRISSGSWLHFWQLRTLLCTYKQLCKNLYVIRGQNMACEKGNELALAPAEMRMRGTSYRQVFKCRTESLEQHIISMLWWNVLQWYGQVLRKDEGDWIKSLAYEVEGARRRGRLKKTWREVVDNDVNCLHLHVSDALDCKK